jgi:transmembrane sensor
MVNKDLLTRYFENACTSEEQEQITLWLSDPRHREEVLQLMDDEWAKWLPAEEELDQSSKEADLPFSVLFRHATASEKKASGSGGMGSILKITASVAACILFLLAGVWIGYYFHGKVSPNRSGPIHYAMAQTLRGQRSRVVLSDGSEVYLNAESRLSFSDETSAHQVIYLEGEAFFKVPANKEKPLIVKTRYLVTSTKGSQFNISAFPRDSTVTVSVENGKAEISANNEKTFPLLNLRLPGHDSASKKDSVAAKPAFMPLMALRVLVVKANESVTFDKNNKVLARSARLNEEELRSWKDGFIYFNHADSAALVDQLERWFDVEVTLITNGLPLKQLNCGFRNATLIEVIRHISNELDLDYRINGKHIFLTRRMK